MAAARNLGHIGRTEVVDIELHRLLGILGLYMHVLDRKGHGGSPRHSPASRPVHDIPVGLSQRAYFAGTFADLAVKCSVKTANGSALAAAVLDFFRLRHGNISGIAR